MNNLPFVSFVIPTFNRANVIRDCLESVVNQTYQNIEIIVINDHSNDNTLQILDEYRNRYKFFKFFDNEGKGASSARNMGIRMAQGQYIAFMDDDDICELFRIEEQMSPIFRSMFYYNFIISSFNVISQSGRVIKVNNYLRKTTSVGFTVRWLVERNLLLQAGGFDLEQPNLEEVEFFFRLKEKAKIFFSTVCVVNVRGSENSLSKDSNTIVEAIERLLKLHSSEMNVYEKNAWLTRLCYTYIKLSSYENFEYYYSQIDKGQFRVFKLLLILSCKIDSLVPLKIYERIKSKFERLLLRKNKKYPLSVSGQLSNIKE